MTLNIRQGASLIRKKFRFSKCTERCTKWISASGNIDLLQLSSEKLIERVLCDAHFEDRFKLCKGLSKTAIPTLNLLHTIEASHCNDIVQNDIDLPNVSSAHHIRKSPDDIDSLESDTITKIAQTKVVEQIDKASIEYATTNTVDLVQAEHSTSFHIQKRTSHVKNTIAAKTKKDVVMAKSKHGSLQEIIFEKALDKLIGVILTNARD
ncbi:uncharacterized protein LOC143908659 [Temnothorax americanus]|uniref:uncharacterized protein LOC143908659 n=1 Tax=Temnothorax americanus TaxID=1964332 RepID=UPI004067A8AD